MKLSKLLETIKNDVQMVTNQEDPEVEFAYSCSKAEVNGGEYDGVYTLGDEKDEVVVIDINFDNA